MALDLMLSPLLLRTVTLPSKVRKYNNQVLAVKWTGVIFPPPPRETTLVVTWVRTRWWDSPHGLGSPWPEKSSCFLLNHSRMLISLPLRGPMGRGWVLAALQWQRTEMPWHRIRTRTRGVLYLNPMCGPWRPQNRVLTQEVKGTKCFILGTEDLEVWHKVKTCRLSQQTAALEENSDHQRIKQEDGLRRSRRSGGRGQGVLVKREKRSKEKSKQIKWVLHFDWWSVLLLIFNTLDWNGSSFTWQISPQNQPSAAESLINTAIKEEERNLPSPDHSDLGKTSLTHTDDGTSEGYTR